MDVGSQPVQAKIGCFFSALVYFAPTAVHHAAIALSATCGRRRCAAFADGECRELLLKFIGMALRTFRRLCPKKDSLKLMSTSFATVFKNRHELPPLLAHQLNRAASTRRTRCIV
jgi:hypothetical protein